MPFQQIPTNFTGTITDSVITASEIDGGEINGAVITGEIIQTSEGPQRLVLDGPNNRLAIYDVNGNLAGYIIGDLAGGFTIYADATNWIEVSDTGIAINAQGVDGLVLSAGAGAVSVPFSLTAGLALAGNTVTSTGGDVTAAQTCLLQNPPLSASAANAIIGAGGRINKFSSRRRYKKAIRRLRRDQAAAVLALPRAVSYQDKAEAKADPNSRRYWGLIVEEIAKTVPELAVYDEHGEPESPHWPGITAALLELARDHARRLAAAGI